MPRSKISDKISVSSGTAADIISDLGVSRQATQRAEHYIEVATKSLRHRVKVVPVRVAGTKVAKKKTAKRKATKK